MNQVPPDIEEVLATHDGSPSAHIRKSKRCDLYYCHWVDVTDDYDVYSCTPISVYEYKRMLTGEVDIQTILKSELTELFRFDNLMIIAGKVPPAAIPKAGVTLFKKLNVKVKYIPKIGDRIRIIGGCSLPYHNKIGEVTRVFSQTTKGDWWYEAKFLGPNGEPVTFNGMLGNNNIEKVSPSMLVDKVYGATECSHGLGVGLKRGFPPPP